MNGGGSCQHHPDFYFGETKRLDLRRNQAFHNASGGDKRDRTADLLNAIQALSQLSYTPMGKMYIIRHAAKCQEFFHAFRKSLKIILCGWV